MEEKKKSWGVETHQFSGTKMDMILKGWPAALLTLGHTPPKPTKKIAESIPFLRGKLKEISLRGVNIFKLIGLLYYLGLGKGRRYKNIDLKGGHLIAADTVELIDDTYPSINGD